MPHTSRDTVARYLHTLVDPSAGAGRADAELLRAFVAGDETAFASLVRRHERLVYSVCRQFLPCREDVEDAFQATFLVLARKANSIRQGHSIASWLFGVACHTARNLRRANLRRRRYENRSHGGTADSAAHEAALREIQAILTEEVRRLPEKLRAPFVLCCLEGKSKPEAAQELGWKEGTVSGRLAHARERLRRRLVRRGVDLTAALCAASLGQDAASAAVSPALIDATAQLALPFAAGLALTPGLAVSKAVPLARGVCRTMLANQFKMALGLVVTVGAVVGAGLLAVYRLPPGVVVAGGSQPADTPRKDSRGSPSKDAEEKGDAVIGGRVLDPAGRPIPGAHVWVCYKANSTLHFRSTTADEQGRFRFEGVPGEATALLAVTAGGRSFAALSYYLRKGQVVNSVKLPLGPPGQLSYCVLGDDGRPVTGAKLSSVSWEVGPDKQCWLPPELFDRMGIPLPESDAQGRLTIPRLPLGVRCRVQITHPDFARHSVEGVAAGDQRRDVRLERGLPLVIVVTEAATGKPAVGATVSLREKEGSEPYFDLPVDSNGQLSVRLTNPKRDYAEVYIRHPNLVPRGSFPMDQWTVLPTRYSLRTQLFRKAKVTGRVVDAKTNQPLARVVVNLFDPTWRQQHLESGLTDQAGNYEIEGPEGKAALAVSTNNGFWADPNQTVDVRLDASRTARAPDLKAKRLPTLRGNVVGPDGKPVVQALVVSSSMLFGDTLVFTDASGQFQAPLKDFYPPIFLSARHPTERLSGGGGIVFADVEAGKTASLQLQPESEIRGTVVDRTGKPKAGVRVRLWSEAVFADSFHHGSAGTDVTDAEGKYRFQALSRHQRYLVAVGQPWGNTTDPRSKLIKPTEPTIQVPPLQVPDDWPAGPPKVKADRTAPEVRCQSWLNSPPLRLADLRGKVVLLTLWGPPYDPCLEELAQARKAQELFADKGLVVLGIHDSTVPVERVRTLLRQHKITFPVGVDEENGETFGQWNVTWLPTRVVIDRNGRIFPDNPNDPHLLIKLRQLLLYGGEKG